MTRKSDTPKITHAQVLELLQRPDYAPLTAPELAAALGLRGGARHALLPLLTQMVMNGEIVMIRKTRYSLGAPADLVTGCLEIKRSGDAYLTDLEGKLDVRIDRGDTETALPGDRVVVRLEPQRRPGPEWQRHGKVIRILDRARRVIVGTLKHTGKFHYVVPLDPAYQQDFYVPDPLTAKVDDRVVVQFTSWENRHVNPEGEVIEVIGPADNPSFDTLAIVRHFGLRDEFSAEVMREAELSAAKLGVPGKRLDLRGSFIFTVDPVTARDFDDALSLERTADGLRELGVHIADVSHFVTRGQALDREALERGNSVYLPDKVLPMLPEVLSNGLCSLVPHQDRLTFSAFITVDEVGQVVRTRCAKSIIRSQLRLTYEQALVVLETPVGMRCRVDGVPPETVALVKAICELAMQLRQRRLTQYALDLNMPECDVVIGADGMINDIRPVVNDISHQMIEECMVAANEAVDRTLSERGLRLIHRLHEPPSEEKIELLTAELKDMGYHPGNLNQRRNLMEFVRSIQETPLAHYAQMAVLRSMKRAVYSAKEGGHYGLAKKYYAHFTSPIRRYPDLVVHRILAAALDGRGNPSADEELAATAAHCSETEKTAQEAERDLLEIKKYRFLAQQLDQGAPQPYEAVVVKVTNFGLFVELLKLEIQGLVHVSALSDRFVRFDPGAHALRVGTLVYKVGVRLTVKITGVNFEKRRLDFALVQEETGQPAGADHPRADRGRGQNRRRRTWRR